MTKNARFVFNKEPRNAVKTEAENSAIIVQIVESISKDKNIKRFLNQSKYGINTFRNGQTLSNLSKRYNRSVRWLRKQLSDVQINFSELTPCPVVIEADATFFNRYEGICIFHAAQINKVLIYAFVESETALIYKTLRNNIERRGFTVLAAVIDGRKGIREVFADVPVQMSSGYQTANEWRLTLYLHFDRRVLGSGSL